MRVKENVYICGMIHDNVKFLLNRNGQTVGGLAAALDVTRQTLHRITTGSPNLATLEKLAAALNVPAWILLHPDPAAALEPQTPGAQEHNATKTTRPAATLPGPFVCPRCGTRLYLSLTPAGLPRTETQTERQHRPGRRKKDTATGEGSLF